MSAIENWPAYVEPPARMKGVITGGDKAMEKNRCVRASLDAVEDDGRVLGKCTMFTHAR